VFKAAQKRPVPDEDTEPKTEYFRLQVDGKTYFCNMVQNLIIFLIFGAAVFYVARMIYKNFSAKSGSCASGCGKCGAVDFNAIEKQLKQKGL